MLAENFPVTSARRLHGVGASVVNALSSALTVEIARGKMLYRQEFSRGTPMTALDEIGTAPNQRGTTVTLRLTLTFLVEMRNFNNFIPYGAIKSLSVCWRCNSLALRSALLSSDETVPAEDGTFSGGL